MEAKLAALMIVSLCLCLSMSILIFQNKIPEGTSDFVQETFNPDALIASSKEPSGSAKGQSAFFRACSADEYEEPEVSSEGWIQPADGYLSAGTWKYPSGDLHLGMDLALPMYSEIMAPADGVILYADAPADEAGGYLGNWCGWPAGGGNTIAMLCIVEDQLYAVTFCHLSSSLYVRAGQKVSQSDVIALSGNSGNSSGPHTHIELFKIRKSWEQTVNYFMETADFSFGTGWDTPAACSEYACQLRPETVLMKGD